MPRVIAGGRPVDEALFALAHIENELVAQPDRSNLIDVVERRMLADPGHEARMAGTVTASILAAEPLTITDGAAALSTYTFNKHVIHHQFCPTCGCAPFGFGQGPGGQEMAAINLRCLEDVDLGAIKRKPVDGRSL